MKELSATLAKGKRTWGQLQARKIIRQPTSEEAGKFLNHRTTAVSDSARAIPPAPLNDSPQVVVRPKEVCKMCGAENSFRQISGPRNYDTFQQAYARCSMCGHKAQIRM